VGKIGGHAKRATPVLEKQSTSISRTAGDAVSAVTARSQCFLSGPKGAEKLIRASLEDVRFGKISSE
jgi:hypothetical protein